MSQHFDDTPNPLTSKQVRGREIDRTQGSLGNATQLQPREKKNSFDFVQTHTPIHTQWWKTLGKEGQTNVKDNLL